MPWNYNPPVDTRAGSLLRVCIKNHVFLKKTTFMSFFCSVRRLCLFLLIAGSMVLGGCSYVPWIGDNEDDLAFEEDFPFNDNNDNMGGRGKQIYGRACP